MSPVGMKSTKRRDWAEARAKVNREGQCRVCKQSPEHLDAAHIIPRSLGGRQVEDAVVPLCRQCHALYDALAFDLLPYLTYNEQAEAVKVVGIERARMRLAPQSYPREAA